MRALAIAPFAACLLAAVACTTPAPPPVPMPSDALEHLRVAPAGNPGGYSETAFDWPARAKQAGWTCTTREAVLLLASPQARTQPGCQPYAAEWHSAYDGLVHTDQAALAVDHVVPLANAWRSGAAAWPASERARFANELGTTALVPATAELVASKAGRGPEEWLPPLVSARCDYARRWVEVKGQWDLTVTPPEKQALAGLLDHC